MMHEGLKSGLRLGVVTAGIIGRTEHLLSDPSFRRRRQLQSRAAPFATRRDELGHLRRGTAVCCAPRTAATTALQGITDRHCHWIKFGRRHRKDVAPRHAGKSSDVAVTFFMAWSPTHSSAW